MDNLNIKNNINIKVATVCIGEMQVENNHRKLPEKCLNVLLTKKGNTLGLLNEGLDFRKTQKDIVLKALNNCFKDINSNFSLEQIQTVTTFNHVENENDLSVGYMAIVNEKPLMSLVDEDKSRWFSVSCEIIGSDTFNSEDRKEVATTFEVRFQNKDAELDIVCCVQKIETHLTADNSMNIEIEVKESSVMNPSDLALIFIMLDRLKNNVSNNIEKVLNFLPKYFTLKEYQSIYELFIGKEIDPSAFRRKVANLVEETDQREYSGSRKAKLFKREINQ